MSGYHGYSMSNNAIEAYENDEKPKSRWLKGEIVDAINGAIKSGAINPKCDKLLFYIRKIPVKDLRDLCLRKSSWHHTSSWYNETSFFSINYGYVENLTEDTLKNYMENIKREKKTQPTEERWRCRFLVWSGSRNHPKATEYEEEGVIRGNWFFRDNGQKKSIYANGFSMIKKLDEN